jgi:hypothetical protein
MSYAPTGNPSATSLKTIAGAADAGLLSKSWALFSFYHPDLDVLNAGERTPAKGLIGEPRAVMQAHTAGKDDIHSARAQGHRHRSYRR